MFFPNSYRSALAASCCKSEDPFLVEWLLSGLQTTCQKIRAPEVRDFVCSH